jgi:hypothetical protein
MEFPELHQVPVRKELEKGWFALKSHACLKQLSNTKSLICVAKPILSSAATTTPDEMGSPLADPTMLTEQTASLHTRAMVSAFVARSNVCVSEQYPLGTLPLRSQVMEGLEQLENLIEKEMTTPDFCIFDKPLDQLEEDALEEESDEGKEANLTAEELKNWQIRRSWQKRVRHLRTVLEVKAGGLFP